MTTPENPERDPSSEGVDLSKGDPAGATFDPYRFGKPEHPIPAEYAPPGYTGPVIPTPPPAPQGFGPGTPGANPANPFSNPPGTPYPPYGQQPPTGQQPPYGQPPTGYQPPAAQPGQHPYVPPSGYYPPQPGAGYRSQSGSTGKAVTSLVLGIGSIVFFWLSFFDAVLVIPGVIFALIAMGEAKAAGGAGRSMAVAGLVCSIVGGLLATVFTVFVVHAANKCGGLNNTNAPGFQTCLRHHFF